MTNPEMSIFPNLAGNTTENQSLSTIIENIRSSSYQLTVEEIREQHAVGNTANADAIKKSLPAFTPSGIFNGSHKSSSLSKYSHILHIDVDKISEEEINKLQQELRSAKDVLAFFRSPSGNGIKVFFLYKDTPENHTANQNKLYKVFQNRYLIQPDISCKDIGRLCFLSHDPDAFYNPNAEPIQFRIEDDFFKWIEHKVEEERGYKFFLHQRNNFVFHFALFCNAEGKNIQEVVEYALNNYIQPDFKEKEIKNAIKSAFNYNNQSNNNKPFTNSKYDHIKAALLHLGYIFRHNTIRNNIELRVDNTWIELTEILLNDLVIKLNQIGIKAKENEIKTILFSSLSEKHNPFTDYIYDLEPWDGKDYIEDLWRTLNLDEVLLPYLRKWLIAIVASMVDSNIINQYVLTLIGPQGVGKTRWINKLIPPSLRQYFSQGIIDLKDKDTKIAVAENLIINLDEIDALNKNETARLKELITSSGYKVRAPYAKIQEFRKRTASFCASVNNTAFLVDKTGSRRYLCIELKESINHLHNIDIDKVYGQAYAAYLNNELPFFNEMETKEIQERNESYETYCMEEELIIEFISIPKTGEQCKKMSATEIAGYLAQMDSNFKPTDRTNRQIGIILTSKGFSKTKSLGITKYSVILKK